MDIDIRLVDMTVWIKPFSVFEPDGGTGRSCQGDTADAGDIPAEVKDIVGIGKYL